MQWRVVIELTGSDGSTQVHEAQAGDCAPTPDPAATVGLTLAVSKQVLVGLQRHLVQGQTEDYCQSRRRCRYCGAQRPLRDRCPRRLRTLFGVVEVRAPRFEPCRCSVTRHETLSPVGEIMPDRCTLEYERTLAKLGGLLPYRRACALLEELFPLGEPPVVETARQRTLQVGARLECQAAAPPRSTSAAAKSITLSIDSGHVSSVRSYQARSFEIIVAQVSNDNGKHTVFASVPAEAYHEAQQLRGVMHDLGTTQTTPVTVLSDGADGPRGLGETASIGPTYHVLDWFHLAMRIHHVAQAIKGWPDDTPENRREAVRLADIVDQHIRWRLWHGQVQRALDLIGGTLGPLEATANDEASPVAASARKVADFLRALETYVSGQSEIIIDYATSRLYELPISTVPTKSTMQWLLHCRMNANQQMRWSPRGAHRMLKVRTSVMNGTFEQDCAAAEWRAKRPYRRAAGLPQGSGRSRNECRIVLVIGIVHADFPYSADDCVPDGSADARSDRGPLPGVSSLMAPFARRVLRGARVVQVICG